MSPVPTNTKEVIATAEAYLATLPGRVFDVLETKKPVSPDAAVNLAKIVSKLSPLVGNLIEFNTCEFLNDKTEFKTLGKWIRQDPGFPDVILQGSIKPTPGFEVKAWFPLATEITARFKDSELHFSDDRTYVAIVAWLPEYLIFGRPQVIGVVTASGMSVAQARDTHYHNPPDYIVLEPEDTSLRARNLQQTNTNGYKWQGLSDAARDATLRVEAEAMISKWGKDPKTYSSSPDYQRRLRELLGKFSYRLDTNFAKMDRIGHPSIDKFATTIYDYEFHGRTVGEWNRLLSRGSDADIRIALEKQFDIKDTSEKLIK